MFLPIETITPGNFLSFGPDPKAVKLRALNVIIGPNGSGKSNLIEAISLIASTPEDLSDFFRTGGGSAQYIWKGGTEDRQATLEVTGKLVEKTIKMPYEHSLSFAIAGQTYEITGEEIFLASPSGRLSKVPTFLFDGGEPSYRIGRTYYGVQRKDYNVAQSVLSDKQDIDFDKPFRVLKRLYRSFRFYRARDFNQVNLFRNAQATDQQNRYLEANGSNLAAVLNRLSNLKQSRRLIEEYMTILLESYEELSFQVQGGTIQLYMTEVGLRSTTPANRLSDGTIRWLALLAILLDPEPPPLVCIEEPETGLHPDIVASLGKLFRQASERTQLIVTTHSDTLVDSLTKDPEHVIVCDKIDGQTILKRLDRAELEDWLQIYTLGPLWRRNLFGGVR